MALGLVCYGRGIAGSEELEMGVGKRNEVCYYGDNFLLFDRTSGRRFVEHAMHFKRGVDSNVQSGKCRF